MVIKCSKTRELVGHKQIESFLLPERNAFAQYLHFADNIAHKKIYDFKAMSKCQRSFSRLAANAK